MGRPAGRIDVHHHLVPPAYAALLRDRGRRPGDVDVPAWTPERSLRLMRRNGIATSILSLSTPGVWFDDPREARRLAREVNEYAGGVVADRPARFGFFATLTLPDVDGAIAEAERGVRLGLEELGLRQLHVARTHVVGDHQAGHVLGNVVGGHLGADRDRLAEHDADLSLPHRARNDNSRTHKKQVRLSPMS